MPEFVVPETNNEVTDDEDEDEDEVVNVQNDGNVYEDNHDDNVIISDPSVSEENNDSETGAENSNE